MRVLVTADSLGGVWTWALELGAALQHLGCEMALAHLGGRLERDRARAVFGDRIYQSDYRLEWMAEPWDEVDQAGEWLLAVEAASRPDVVLLHSLSHGSLAWRAPTVAVVHSCVLSWWEAVRGERAPDHWARYRERVADGLAGATCVTAPSRAMLAAARRHYGAFREGPVVYNGRTASRFAPHPKAPYLFAAGRLWDDGKNLGLLEEVAPRLPWPVFVVGDGTSPDGVTRHFRWARSLGRLEPETVARWLGCASIYVLPARYEPFGLSVLEAALAGCALVLGDIPSLREIWGDAALYVAPDDANALEDQLRRLIADPARRASLAARAHLRAREFTPERMGREYLALARSALAGGRQAEAAA